jgi:uncharacterized damage-inducible protein DinB
MHHSLINDRRQFLKNSAIFAASPFLPAIATAGGQLNTKYPHDVKYTDDALNIIGPKEGYSSQIGTLVSMMAWLRPQVMGAAKGLTTEQLDFLLDDQANTIGAMLYHLAATDAFYHENTFKNIEWGKWDITIEKKFGVAMELGENGRKMIKGNNADFYLTLLQETRASTLAQFKQHDDKWLMSVDAKWPWGPTNNYCKWFHVCEHESHHLGQIAFLKSRLPKAKNN